MARSTPFYVWIRYSRRASRIKKGFITLFIKNKRSFCHPEQLVITSGATQALTLVSKLLLSTGDEVIIEDPITNDIQTILKIQEPSFILYQLMIMGWIHLCYL